MDGWMDGRRGAGPEGGLNGRLAYAARWPTEPPGQKSKEKTCNINAYPLKTSRSLSSAHTHQGHNCTHRCGIKSLSLVSPLQLQ